MSFEMYFINDPEPDRHWMIYGFVDYSLETEQIKTYAKQQLSTSQPKGF